MEKYESLLGAETAWRAWQTNLCEIQNRLEKQHPYGV